MGVFRIFFPTRKNPETQKNSEKVTPKKKGEKGTALVELAIVAPFLLLTAVQVYDLASMVDAHHSLQAFVREGVRKAGVVPNLEPGRYQLTYNSQTSDWKCSGPGLNFQSPGAACSAPKQQALLESIRRSTVGLTKSESVDRTTLNVVVQYDKARDFVKVTLAMDYLGLMMPFKNQHLLIEEMGPYL